MSLERQMCGKGFDGEGWPTVGTKPGGPWYMNCCILKSCIHIPPQLFWQQYSGAAGSSFSNVAMAMGDGQTAAILGDSVSEQICRTTACDLLLHGWKQVQPAPVEGWNFTDSVMHNHSETRPHARGGGKCVMNQKGYCMYQMGFQHSSGRQFNLRCIRLYKWQRSFGHTLQGVHMLMLNIGLHFHAISHINSQDSYSLQLSELFADLKEASDVASPSAKPTFIWVSLTPESFSHVTI
jgi:hypothetical protein